MPFIYTHSFLIPTNDPISCFYNFYSALFSRRLTLFQTLVVHTPPVLACISIHEMTDAADFEASLLAQAGALPMPAASSNNPSTAPARSRFMDIFLQESASPDGVSAAANNMHKRSYTKEFLLSLRFSPLVKSNPLLPEILQRYVSSAFDHGCSSFCPLFYRFCSFVVLIYSF